MLGNNSCQALKWASQGGGGVIIPAGVQEMFRCCTEGCGLVGNIGVGWLVGLGDLRGLFQPWSFYDSVCVKPWGVFFRFLVQAALGGKKETYSSASQRDIN